MAIILINSLAPKNEYFGSFYTSFCKTQRVTIVIPYKRGLTSVAGTIFFLIE